MHLSCSFLHQEMALLKKKYSEVPPDAIVLTENEALKYQTRILNKWQYSSDVFAYRYGSYLLGITSFLTGVFVNNYWRNKFHLFHYGRAASYLPACVIPATLSTIAHVEFVVKDVVLQKRGNCPVCLEMRSSAIQSFVGCVFPAVLAPVSALALAHSYATYDIPYVTKEPMKVWKLVKTKTNPILNILFAIFLGQAILGSTVTYFEAKSVITVNTKLAKLEEQLENGSYL